MPQKILSKNVIGKKKLNQRNLYKKIITKILGIDCYKYVDIIPAAATKLSCTTMLARSSRKVIR